MTTELNQSNKQRVWDLWQQLNSTNEADVADIARKYVDQAIELTAAHPINQQHGRDAVVANLWQPFLRAFPGLHRECYVFICGQFADKNWVAATGVFSGTFVRDWLGIPASGKMTKIRFGEFCALREGKIVENYLLLDLVDVMRQAGYAVFPPAPNEEYWPRPFDVEGVLLSSQAEAESKKSLHLVEAMIGGLGRYDGADASKMKQTDFWSPQMHWYGPCGIGSSRHRAEYERNHQTPFLTAFPDRKGGNHKARIAEGHFVASTGWPSVRATHQGEYLGCPATGKPISMRVADWWRREGDVLVQNWVFIDLPDLFMQFGVDLFARLR